MAWSVRISPFSSSDLNFFARRQPSLLPCLLWVDFRVRNLDYRYPICNTDPMSGEGWSHPIMYCSEHGISLYNNGMVFSPSFSKC